MTQRIGLFGGTFDPVHQGHINACNEITNELELDRLFMIPAFRPVHKELPDVSIQSRLDMLALACEPESALDFDDREIQRGGPSYTLLTIQEYRQLHPDASLYFILGMDAFEKFDSWYHWQEFLNYVNLVVVDRPGHEQKLNATLRDYTALAACSDLSTFKASQRGFIYHSKRAMLRYSSTEVRENIHNSTKIVEMLPEKVLNYIHEHQLYR